MSIFSTAAADADESLDRHFAPLPAPQGAEDVLNLSYLLADNEGQPSVSDDAAGAKGKLHLAQLVTVGWMLLVYEEPDGSLTPVRIVDAEGHVEGVDSIRKSTLVWVYIDADSVVRPLQIESDGGLTPARADAAGNPILPSKNQRPNLILTAQVNDDGKLLPIIRPVGQGFLSVRITGDGAIVRAAPPRDILADIPSEAPAEEEGDIQVSVDVDNSGGGETGLYNVTGTVKYANVAGTDHEAIVAVTSSATDPLGYASIFGAYSIPVDGMVEDLPDTLSLAGYTYNIDYENKTDSDPAAKKFAINGYGFAPSYTQFLDLTETEEGSQTVQALIWGATYDRYYTRDYGYEQDSRTSLVRFPLALTYGVWHSDPTFGSSSLTVGYARNLSVFSASDGDDYRANRTNADPRYEKWTGSAYHGFQFESGWETSLNIDGQWAHEPLISAEGFALGGPGSVRGLESSKTVGDKGAAGQFEITTPSVLPSDYFSGKFAAFADYGWTKVIDPDAGDPGSETALGLGGGIKFSTEDDAYLNVMAGWLAGGSAVERYSGEDGRLQIYLNAGFTF